jgi:IS5 family transposase
MMRSRGELLRMGVMKQLTLATVGFGQYAKMTRRARFLAEMERVVPWPALCGLIEPFHPKPGNGRPPVGVERMLRIYLLRQWFYLSDRRWTTRFTIRWRCVGSSESISAASRRPTRPRCAASAACSSSTIWAGGCSRRCSSTLGRGAEGRHRHDRRRSPRDGGDHQCALFDQECRQGARSRDASDEEGNQRYFGRKAHFGVDRRIKLIHTVVATPANVADSAVLPDLLHGKETRVWGDQTYRGQQAMILRHAPRAQDFINRRYRRSRRRGRDRAGEKPPQVQDAGQQPALAIAGVEHPIGVIKRVLGFAKVRYRGLKKNARRLLVTYALANLSWHAGICCAARRARRVRTRPTYRADNAIRPQNGAAVPPCRSLRNSFCSHPRASLLFRRSLNRGIAPPSSSAK